MRELYLALCQSSTAQAGDYVALLLPAEWETPTGCGWTRM
jgi:hypothetical protein